MRRAAGWVAALVVGLAAVVGLIALFNARDDSRLEQPARTASGGPGEPYRDEPPLSPALEAAVARGNVVLLYRDAQPPAGTEGLATGGGHALEAAGQAVVLEREPTLDAPLAAVADRRIQQADVPQELEPFIDYWLGGR